jgi:hypothetical protein
MRIILLFITLVITSACSKSLKEKIGITTSGPNEYKVQRNKSLEVPPHYDLPPPVMPGGRAAAQVQEHISTTTTNLNNGEKALMDDIDGR